ncbi:hypothetical protein FDUTEX481_03058 [Tolypothrix sp. PCC 7601]|nr:hypothetical protein FDUTEX481_03058 [Tolypothrix sp. PCC 7601]
MSAISFPAIASSNTLRYYNFWFMTYLELLYIKSSADNQLSIII